MVGRFYFRGAESDENLAGRECGENNGGKKDGKNGKWRAIFELRRWYNSFLNREKYKEPIVKHNLCLRRCANIFL